MIQKVEQVLKEFEAHQGAIIQENTFGLIQKRPGVADVTEKIQNAGVMIQLHAAHQNKFNAISQKMEELQINCDFDVIQETGGAFNNYGEIDNVFDEGKTVLAHKPGEVLLVDVWATWCGPCQKPMKHNQQMLQKNEGVWGERVRIVGVSVDDEKETIKERVTSRKWEKVTHLTLLGWKNDHALIKDFRISGIPFVCLVNKWGKINYVGHPSSINLQTRINQLLNEHQDASLKQKEVAAPVQHDNSIKEGIDKLVKVFTKQNIQKEFKDAQLACFKYTKQEKKEKGVTSAKLNLAAYFVDGDHVSEQLLRKIIGDTKGVQLTIEKVKYTKLPQVQNPSCSLCNASELKYPFYWLRWEEGEKFGCRACVQKNSGVEGHHFAYEKNSVLLRGKWERVGTKDLGKNLQPADVKAVESDHGFSCNGCGGGSEGIGHARYISLGCRADPNFKSGGYVDLCDGCAFKLLENNEEVINQLKPEGNEPNHPFLRVLYNTQGYFEF